MTTLQDMPIATKTTAGKPTSVDLDVQAGDGALIPVPAGGRLRIVDLQGNQAVDTLLYDAHDVDNRYSAFDTVREQGAIYLTTGSRLLSSRRDELAVITDDTCGRHDTIGGAASATSTRTPARSRSLVLSIGCGVAAAIISRSCSVRRVTVSPACP